MGLLTNPGAGQGKVTAILVKHHSLLCFFLYIGGVIWLLLLAYEPFNNATYISENALLPGLVHNEFNQESQARIYFEELQEELKKYKTTIPYPWILAKFRQLGLDTYTHNFTLNFPLGIGSKYEGKNVYGIMRALRAASTESLVLTIPYRPPNSAYAPTTPSIALMLAFAGYVSRQKYWAKDIIFLLTEHEQLGIQAWLEAYHGVYSDTKILNAGNLDGRAGAIQAAICLELHDTKIEYIDVKVEGLNGQLPNLDLFNLAHRLARKEGIKHTYKQRTSPHTYDQFESWLYSFEMLMTMMLSQSTGVPTGNHGLFHRFGIEAITLEGYAKSKSRSYVGLQSVGRLLESIFRSLNNLLERFHQSFFFYLLPSTDRFISIGLYMPALSALAAALLLKAFALWLKIQDRPFSEIKKECEKSESVDKSDQLGDGDKNEVAEKLKKSIKSEESDDDNEKDLEAENKSKKFDIIKIGSIFLVAHMIGIGLINAPIPITQFGTQYGFPIEHSIYYSFGIISVVLLMLPFLLKIQDYNSAVLLNILALLELATMLLAVGMYNFSLAFCCATIYVPCLLWINPASKRTVKSIFQIFLWLILHPFIIATVVVTVYTYVMFSEETLKRILFKGLSASQSAFVYSITDSLIYGNWLFNLVLSVCLPNWLCFWSILFVKSKSDETGSSKLKTE